MPPEQTSAPVADGPLSIDAATALLTPEAVAPEEEKKKQPPEAPDTPALEDIEAATAPEEEEAEFLDDGEEEEAEPAPAIPMPRSWSKEDAAAWEDLSPAAREVVAKREADRDRAVAAKAQETARLNHEVQTLAQRFQEVAPVAQDRAAAAEQTWTQKWANVDWVAVAQQYSAEEYNQIRAECEAERDDVLYLRDEAYRLAQEAKHTSELAYQRFIAEEAQKLPTMAPELIDPEKGAERRQKVAEHLFSNGYDPETVKHMSAFELTTTWKAMMWDEAQKRAKAQTQMPRKQPPGSPPRGIAPNAASPGASPKRALQGLETRLTKERSVDAAVELLMARQSGRK